MTKQLTKALAEVRDDTLVPSTGKYVALWTDDPTPILVVVASENPTSSGNYIANFTTQPKIGWWYVGDDVATKVKRTDFGSVWLGEGFESMKFYRYEKVQVYNPIGSPTGDRGNPIVFTSGASGNISSQGKTSGQTANGMTPTTFVTAPTVIVDGSAYQERKAMKTGLVTLSSGNAVFSVQVDDAGNNASDGYCYADILIISND